MSEKDPIDPGAFIGKVISRMIASGADSVLKDVGIEARKIDRKVQKARMKIRVIKENPDGREEEE